MGPYARGSLGFDPPSLSLRGSRKRNYDFDNFSKSFTFWPIGVTSFYLTEQEAVFANDKKLDLSLQILNGSTVQGVSFVIIPQSL